MGSGQPDFSFDAVLREAHTSELVTTSNPVETGVPITDHAYMMPFKLEIEGGVGDAWLGMRDASKSNIGANQDSENIVDDLEPLGPANQDVSWLVGNGGGDSTTRSQRAWQSLVNLQKSAAVFKVQTGLMLYPDMVLKSLTAEQGKDTSTVLYFTAQLEQVIFVSTETVTLPPRKAGKTKRQGPPKTNKGEQKSEKAKASDAFSAMRGLLGEDKAKQLKDNPLGFFTDFFAGGP